MEAHAHRFHQCTLTGCEQSGGNHLLPRQHQSLAHRAIALYAQRLVVLAGIGTRIAARGTLATIGVGIHRDHHAGLQSFRHLATHGLDDGSHLMTGNDGEFHHRVSAQIGVKVTATKSNILQANHHIACLHLLFGDIDNLHLSFPSYLYCFHIYMVQMRCARSRFKSSRFKVQYTIHSYF